MSRILALDGVTGEIEERQSLALLEGLDYCHHGRLRHAAALDVEGPNLREAEGVQERREGEGSLGSQPIAAVRVRGRACFLFREREGGLACLMIYNPSALRKVVSGQAA